MRNYEIMIIVKSNLEVDNAKKEVENIKKIITGGKGKVISTNEMGQRKLAYPIKKEISGFYFVLTFSATSETLNELERRIKINENILRHLIIRTDEE